MSVWLRGLRVVLVDETAQHVVTTDTERWGSGDDPRAGHRHFKIDASVRTLLVVVGDILAKNPLQVTATEDEHPVETFGPNGPDPSFGVGVRPRRTDRRLDHPGALRSKDLVEAGRELCVAIPDEELDGSRAICQVTHQVAGYLGDEGTGWVIGDTADVHLSSRKFDHEEGVELCE